MGETGLHGIQAKEYCQIESEAAQRPEPTGVYKEKAQTDLADLMGVSLDLPPIIRCHTLSMAVGTIGGTKNS